MYPFLVEAGVFQVVVAHCVANVDVELQEARNLKYDRRHGKIFNGRWTSKNLMK